MNTKLSILVLAMLPGAANAQSLSPAQLAVAQACREDIQTHWEGVQPGEGRIGVCLRENASKLSEGCKKAIMENRSSMTPAPAAQPATAPSTGTPAQ